MAKQFRYDDVPPVQTKAGLLHGYQFEGVYIFKGVPYAQAGRFQLPRPVDAWEGVREACSYGYVSPMLTQDNPTGEIMVPHRYWPMDENCQNLNVWTKSLDPAAKKPVLVWLHGGGYSAGSSIEQVAYDGASMCDAGDVVVVTVNHRLNILGFMDLSPFGEKYKNSANAGLADLVAALEWVRDNIAAFGGDAGNVTIFGQSGGGMKVTGLMQIPAADGLFHKGLVMSGVNDGKLLPPAKGDGRQIVAAMLAELGLGGGDVEKLETVPYHDLAQAYNKVFMGVAMQGGYVGNAPLPDDYYLGEPLLSGFTEHAKTIPLMIGSVYGEFAFAPSPYLAGDVSPEKEKALLAEQFGERTDEVMALFAKTYPEKRPLDILALDRVFRAPTKALARLAGENAPTYLYNFTLDFAFQNGKPAWHCADIPFFFNNTSLVEVANIPGKSDELENQIFTALMQFAKTGDPNHPGLPAWPPVTPAAEPTLVMDSPCRVENNYDDELLALLDEVLPPFDLMKMFSGDVQH